MYVCVQYICRVAINLIKCICRVPIPQARRHFCYPIASTHLFSSCEEEGVQPCTTIERPITSQTFNCSDATWNVALPVLSAATVAMCPATALSGVVYISPQLWRRGRGGKEGGRDGDGKRR